MWGSTMHNFFGSRNSRYFVYHREGEMSLARGEKVLWKKSVPQERFKILGVANNGSVATIYSEGIQIFGCSESDPVEFVEPFSRVNLSESASHIGQAIMNENGTQICLDKISEETNLTGKLFSVFAASPGEKGLEQHEIIFYSLQNKNFGTYYKFAHPKQLEFKFRWNISRDFNFLVIGEPQKTKGGIKIKLSIVNVNTFEQYQELTIQNPRINDLAINNYGTVVSDLIGENGREIMILTAQGQKHTVSVPPSDFELIHVGRNFVALQTRPAPSIMIKSFEDILLCHADLKALDELGIPYSAIFNEKDDIDFIYVMEGELKYLASGIDRIHIDAKRWEYISNQLKASSMQEPLKIIEQERKRISMDGAIEKTAQQPPQPERKPVPEERVVTKTKDELIRTLETLKLGFITGQIGDEEYNRAKEQIEQDLTSLENQQSSTVIETPQATPRTISIDDDFPEPPPKKKETGPDVARIEKLLAALEERLIFGEISEETYRELKEKYSKQLAESTRVK
jgi:uncharacterized membrane protein